MQMAWKGGCAGAVLVICFGDAFLGVAPMGVPVGIPWYTMVCHPVLGSFLRIATLMIALLSMKRPPVFSYQDRKRRAPGPSKRFRSAIGV